MVKLFSELFQSHATSFFGFDLLLTAFACMIFIIVDGRRNKIPRLWLPISGVFIIGIGFAFPFYLYLREMHIKHD